MFTDHVLRYQDTPGVKMIVVLGEVRNKSCSFHFDYIDCFAYCDALQEYLFFFKSRLDLFF